MHPMNRLINSALVACLVACAITVPVRAGEDGSETDKPTRVLEGSVRGSVILFDEGMAKIGMARELVQESTAKIMKEATRKDTIVVRGPNAIGNGIVLPPLGGVGGVMQFGELPIRKDKLQRFLAESEQNLAALQSYVDGLVLPRETSSSLEESLSSMRVTMQSAQEHMQRLKELSSQKRLLNIKIGKEALKIYDAMTSLEKQKTQMLEAVATANAPSAAAAPQPATEGSTAPAASTTSDKAAGPEAK